MHESTKVKTRKQDGIAIMDLSGEVTSFSEQVLQETYVKFTEEGFSKIGLNFENVSYINSAGMAIIISILTQSRNKGQALRAWGLTQHFQKIFDMVGITKYMEHFESEGKALKDF
ncbi:MAG: STAS domain-containing protein [bacterium]